MSAANCFVALFRVFGLAFACWVLCWTCSYRVWSRPFSLWAIFLIGAVIGLCLAPFFYVEFAAVFDGGFTDFGGY